MLFLTLWLCRNLVHSRWGRASMAIRESELAAASSGVETYAHKVSAFALSAGIVSVAGVIGAERFLLVSPISGGQEQSFRYVIMIALGGLGTIAGPIIGAFSLTFGFGLTWVQEHLVNQQNLVFGLLGLIGVALAPEGTMGNINKLLAGFRHRQHNDSPSRVAAATTAAYALPVRVVPTASGPPALELSGVTKRFGGVVAVNNVDLVVEPGEVHGLIGPNGSGKTTLLNMISGIAPVTSGRVMVMGHDDTKSSAPKRSGRGVSRTFQNLQLWKKMTVRDNVLVGCHRTLRVNTLQAAFGTPGGRRAERDAAQRCDDLLSLVGLAERSNDLAGALPFAEQRRLEIARALAASPSLLLLDEPAAGLHPADVHHLLELIRAIKASGVSVVLVEHHMELLMAVSDVITVLEFGSIIAEGTPAEVQGNAAVVAAYLGVQEDVA